jgi:sugar lactone lactonase YvrE
VAVLGAAAVVLAGMSSASAQPAAEGPQVIASGLNSPRGLAFRGDDLYVAEAGTGGTGPCLEGPEGRSCWGPSGSVTRIDDDGGQTRVLTGLSSLAAEGTGETAIGPSDVAFKRGEGSLVVTEGLGLDLDVSKPVPQLDDMGQLLRARPSDGTWKTIADLAEFEDANNPTGDEENVNPQSVIALHGRSIVADAGANDLLRVRSGGRVTVLATFPDRLVDAPPFLGLPPGAQIPMDAVPTSVAIGPDGAFYVGQLTGFPFPVGSANVYRVERGGEPEVFASGFTNIIDIAFAEDGTMYVLEIFQNGLLSGDPTGALIRVDANGDQEVIMSEGLITPGGLALRGGNAYVSNCGTCAGTGEVLRIPIDD